MNKECLLIKEAFGLNSPVNVLIMNTNESKEEDDEESLTFFEDVK